MRCKLFCFAWPAGAVSLIIFYSSPNADGANIIYADNPGAPDFTDGAIGVLALAVGLDRRQNRGEL